MAAVLLIVEDDDALRNGMKLLLQRVCRHPCVLTAATLAEAREHIVSAVPSHMILDLNLPDGLGTELLKLIRTEASVTSVLVLTGSVNPALLNEAKELGAGQVMSKPPDWQAVARWSMEPAST